VLVFRSLLGFFLILFILLIDFGPPLFKLFFELLNLLDHFSPGRVALLFLDRRETLTDFSVDQLLRGHLLAIKHLQQF